MPISTPVPALDKYGEDPGHFMRVAKYIFKPAAEQAGFEFRSPVSASSEIIQAEIIENLETAELVLCDISQWNANVFFELGIRVALDRPVAIIKDNLTDKIPFDTAMLNCYTYDPSLDISHVEAEIPKLTAHIETAKGQKQNALWRYFGITQRAERNDSGSSEEAKLDLILAKLAVLELRVARSNDFSDFVTEIGETIEGTLTNDEREMLQVMDPKDRARYLLQKRIQKKAEGG